MPSASAASPSIVVWIVCETSLSCSAYQSIFSNICEDVDEVILRAVRISFMFYERK